MSNCDGSIGGYGGQPNDPTGDPKRNTCCPGVQPGAPASQREACCDNNVTSPAFRELMVRWYQMGAFHPVFRTHGHRMGGPLGTPAFLNVSLLTLLFLFLFQQMIDRDLTVRYHLQGNGASSTNEAWNFGADAFAAIKAVMLLRESLRPYIAAHFERIVSAGAPITRPLLWDFPADTNVRATCDLKHDCASETQAMFGPDLMVAPQLHLGATARAVYLPQLGAGEHWEYYFTNQSMGRGGNTITQQTPLAEFPLYRRVGGSDPGPPPAPAPSSRFSKVGNGFCTNGHSKRPQTYLCDNTGNNPPCPSTQRNCGGLCAVDAACTGFMLQDQTIYGKPFTCQLVTNTKPSGSSQVWKLQQPGSGFAITGHDGETRDTCWRKSGGSPPSPSSPYLDLGPGYCVSSSGVRPESYLCADKSCGEFTESSCAALCTADFKCTGFMIQNMSMYSDPPTCNLVTTTLPTPTSGGKWQVQNAGNGLAIVSHDQETRDHCFKKNLKTDDAQHLSRSDVGDYRDRIPVIATRGSRWTTTTSGHTTSGGRALKLDDGAASPPVKLIIDTDMSTDVDDVAAVCIAHALADAGEVELAAIVHNTGLAQGAGAISVINHYYGRDDVPIGAFRSTTFATPANRSSCTHGGNPQWCAGPYVLPLLAKFPSPIRNSTQVPTGVDVYRKVLAAADDHSITISSIGFMSNLAGLLASKPDKYSKLNGHDLVAKKVKQIAWMGGQYPNSTNNPLKTGVEWNMGGGFSTETGPWSAASVNGWPSNVPVVFSGFEMGVQIFTGAPLAGRCCNAAIGCGQECAPHPAPLPPAVNACQPVTNPCRAAFESYHTFDPNCPPRQSWDPATTLFAVRGAGTFWSERATGYNVVLPNGGNAWVDDGKSHNRSYLVLQPGEPTGDPGWSSKRLVAKAIDDLLCAKPTLGAKADAPASPPPLRPQMQLVPAGRVTVGSSADKLLAGSIGLPGRPSGDFDEHSPRLKSDDSTIGLESLRGQTGHVRFAFKFSMKLDGGWEWWAKEPWMQKMDEWMQKMDDTSTGHRLLPVHMSTHVHREQVAAVKSDDACVVPNEPWLDPIYHVMPDQLNNTHCADAASVIFLDGVWHWWLGCEGGWHHLVSSGETALIDWSWAEPLVVSGQGG